MQFSLQKAGSKLRNRFFLLLGFGVFALFGSRRALIGGSSLAGAGALAVLILSFVAGLGWDVIDKVCCIFDYDVRIERYLYDLLTLHAQGRL